MLLISHVESGEYLTFCVSILRLPKSTHPRELLRGVNESANVKEL